MTLEVLRHHDGIVAVHKPAGIETTGRTIDDVDCLQGQLAAQLARSVWAVHQLDRGTSGVVLFVVKKALVAPASQRLRRGAKTYLLIGRGAPTWDKTSVDEPIAYDRRHRRYMVSSEGRDASTRFTLLDAKAGFYAALARPATGRTHQIRVHAAHLKLPLLGDQRYGGAADDGSDPPDRHALHLWSIALPGDPEGPVTSSVPPDLRELAAALGLELPDAPPTPRRHRR